MAHVMKDRVREVSTTTGTGAMTLGGAITTYRAFSSVMTSPSDTCFYAIAHQSANEWETGLGTYSSANTLTRTTVIASSNANAAVSFSAGTKEVAISWNASSVAALDTAGDIVKSQFATGAVLQTVFASTTTQYSSTSTSYADTNLTATITPYASTSKILIFVNQAVYFTRAGTTAAVGIQLLRGATVVLAPTSNVSSGPYENIMVAGGATNVVSQHRHTMIWQDSPATTSATTYKTQIRSDSGTQFYCQNADTVNATSTITLMEIAG